MRDPAEMTSAEIDQRRRESELDNMARHLLLRERRQPGAIAEIAALPPEAQRDRLWDAYAGVPGARLLTVEWIGDDVDDVSGQVFLIDEDGGRDGDGVPHVALCLGGAA